MTEENKELRPEDLMYQSKSNHRHGAFEIGCSKCFEDLINENVEQWKEIDLLKEDIKWRKRSWEEDKDEINFLKSQNQRMLSVCHYATNKFIKRQWNEIEVLAKEALKEVKE